MTNGPTDKESKILGCWMLFGKGYLILVPFLSARKLLSALL